MNVIKEAIQRLRVHLGRDSIGINLLDAITAIANDQRKRNAALEESSATDRELVKTLRAQLHELQTQVAMLTNALGRQSALRAAAQQREQAAVAQVEKPEELEKMTGLDLERRMLALLRNAQRRFKKLPIRKDSAHLQLYLEDFVKNYTYDEFAGLGMTLAACAIVVASAPALVVEQTLKDVRHLPADYDPDKDMVMARFIHWFRGGIKSSPTEDKIYRMMSLPKE